MKRKLTFSLLLVFLLNILLLPNINLVFANNVELDVARKAAEKRITLDVEAKTIPNWEGAHTGNYTTYFDLNGNKSAYVFTVTKDTMEIGTITVSAKFSSRPILEYGEFSTDPAKNLPQAKNELKQKLLPGEVLGEPKLLYLGALNYAVEFPVEENGVIKDSKVVNLLGGNIKNKSELTAKRNKHLVVKKDAQWDKYLDQRTLYESNVYATTYTAYSVLDGVPNYRWYKGCATTAGGNVMTYWGVRGHRGLVRSINSKLVWRSTLDRLAETMDADLSKGPGAEGYGAVYLYKIPGGINTYLYERGYQYSYNVFNTDITWSDYVSNIAAARPPIITLISAQAYNNGGDHSVVGVGYSQDNYGDQYLIVNDAWGQWNHKSNYNVAYGDGYDLIESQMTVIYPLDEPGSRTIGFGSRTLSYGSSGNDVAELQARLDAQNYYLGTIDGIFGNMTKNAAVNFQRDNGLSADGIVGPVTTSALKSKDYQTNYYYPNP